MFRKGFSIGKVFGIEIRIDYSWFWIFLLVAWSFGLNTFPRLVPGLNFLTYVLLGILGSISLFISVLAHEIAHSLVARRNGLKIDRIVLFLFGGASNLHDEPPSAKVEFKMAFIGPLLSVVLGGLLLTIALIRISPTVNAFLFLIGSINIVLAVFNMLPAFPLDGGRVFRSFLWWRTKNLGQSTRRASILSQVISVFLIFYGVLQILIANIIGGFWVVIIGYFLFQSARASYKITLMMITLKDLSVGELLSKNLKIIDSGIKVKNLSEKQLSQLKTTSFVSKNEKIIGTISIKNLTNTSESTSEQKLEEIMTPIDDEAYLGEKDCVRTVVSKFSAYQTDILPVLKQGTPIGIIKAEDIENFLFKNMLRNKHNE